jgi:hypothetical protein
MTRARMRRENEFLLLPIPPRGQRIEGARSGHKAAPPPHDGKPQRRGDA